MTRIRADQGFVIPLSPDFPSSGRVHWAFPELSAPARPG